MDTLRIIIDRIDADTSLLVKYFNGKEVDCYRVDNEEREEAIADYENVEAN